MTELLWQTVFSLMGAFFLGAVVACGLKRRFYYGPPQKKAAADTTGAPVAPNDSQPKIEVAARDGDRFGRALAGQSAAPASAAPRASASPVAAPAPAAAKPAAAPATPPPTAPQPEVPQGIPRVSVSRGSGAPMKVDEGGAGPSDDLTRIRGIDTIMQGRLKELGLRRYQDLAGLTPADVRGLAATLGLKDRITEENWVGQAQILAAGQATYFSRRNDEGVPIPANAEPSAKAPATAAMQPPASVAPSRPSHAANDASAPGDVAYLRSVRSEALLGDMARRRSNDVDDLKRIRGIGVLIEKKLNSLGVLSYEQVANWTGADIERISRILDFKGRIEREHWIEQARILATGGQTEFSRRGER